MSVVNIFSGSFCGAEEAAHDVTASLHSRLVRDEDIIGLAARESGLAAGILRRTMFGKASLFNQFTHERDRAASHLKLAMARTLEEDDLVFLGFAAQLVPRTISHILHVCLIAEIKHRTHRAVRELGLSEKEAQIRLHRDNEAAIRWIEYLGLSDPWNPARYDILIPLDKTPLEEAVGLIRDHAQGQALAPTAASRRAGEDFVLAARVELALAETGHSLQDVAVGCGDGKVTVQINKKVLRLGHLSEELKKVAGNVDGVREVAITTGPGYYQADVYRRAEFHLPSKVLLVDDEREFVQTLSERLLLRKIGSAVVYDGQEALRVMAEEEPEVIVLDLKMPGLDGVEVLRRIKRDYPKVEVIILTGHGSERDKETCLNLGAYAYLEKPVDIDQLSQYMRQAHEKVRRVGD
jgi:CheY-like chemotaxis protein